MVAKSKQQPKHMIHHYLQARPSLAIRGFIGLVLGYAFLSRAFDTGSYWQYLGAIVFTLLGLQLLGRSLKSYGKK